MSESPGKTPVSFLQEMCIKHNIFPQYEVLANEGAVHEPIFVMKVEAGKYTATGRGASKQKAKHGAAQNLIAMITGAPTMETELGSAFITPEILSFGTPKAVSKKTSSTSPDWDGGLNPVGELQEYAQKHLKPPPEYTSNDESGPPHAREFKCIVRFENMEETGIAKSKKDAKRSAASKMVQMIKRVMPRGTLSAPFKEEDYVDDDEDATIPLVADDTLQYDVIKLKTVPVLTADSGQAASDFFDTLRKDPGNCLLGLHGTSLSGLQADYVNKLKEIAKEKKFEVIYVDIEEISKSGQYQCLVQLSTEPVAVCFGTGATRQEAQMEAAYNSLQYLKIMTSQD